MAPRLKQRRSAASQSLNLGLRLGWIVLVIWCEARIASSRRRRPGLPRGERLADLLLPFRCGR